MQADFIGVSIFIFECANLSFAALFKQEDTNQSAGSKQLGINEQTGDGDSHDIDDLGGQVPCQVAPSISN